MVPTMSRFELSTLEVVCDMVAGFLGQDIPVTILQSRNQSMREDWTRRNRRY